MYRFSYGEYGLHKDGWIVKIKYHSVDISPQEIHYKKRGNAYWSYFEDFIAFSNSKRKLRRLRRRR
jgi:hypothetical protein